MAIPVGYRYLYDPDFDDDYDDQPKGIAHSCDHGHGHAHSHDTEEHENDDTDDDDDDTPPPLIPIEDLIDPHIHDAHCMHSHEGHDTSHEYTYSRNIAAESEQFFDYPEFSDTSRNLKVSEADTASLVTKALRDFVKYLGEFWLLKILVHIYDIATSGALRFIKWVAAPLRKIYHSYYVPYVLVGVLNLLGGSAHAGQLGRHARIFQFLGTVLTWTTLIVLIAMIGFTTVWTLGMAAPVWALVLGFMGIGINMSASLVASAANHGKIEQYYHEELRQHTENNALKIKMGMAPMELEHGLHASDIRRNTLKRRYTHDANVYGGSGISIIAGVLDLAATAVGLAGMLFMISRFSSVIGVMGASFVNGDRLSAYKRSISKIINTYYELKHKASPKKHKAIYTLLNRKFNELNISRKNPYTRWVKFRCYRAMDSVYATDQDILSNTEQINETLSAQLNELLEDDRGLFAKNKDIKKRFARDKLRHILHADGPDVAILDGMPVLEGQLRSNLQKDKNSQYASISSAVDTFINNKINRQDIATCLFVLHLKQSLLKHKLVDIDAETLESVFSINSEFFIKDRNGKYIIHQENISNAYPLQGPHGSQIIPDYHAKQLVDKIIITCLKNQSSATHVGVIVNEFYRTDMNNLAPLSALFILHLKCSLIEALVKNKIKMKNITCANIRSALQDSGCIRAPSWWQRTQLASTTLDKDKITQEYHTDDSNMALMGLVQNNILHKMKNI